MSEQDANLHSLQRRTKIALSAGVAALLAFPLLTVGRLIGLWDAPLPLIGLAFFVALFGMLTAIIAGALGLIKRHGKSWDDNNVRGALVSLVLGIVVAIPIVPFLHLGLSSPPIHDITTDTVNPPVFVSLLAEREATNAPNSAEYDFGIVEQQKSGYPDLGPIVLDVPAADAFTRVVETVNDMGWRLAAAVPEEGRVEAVDVTFWSGFVDDIVIRVTPAGDSQSRIDVRSLSRVGGSDVGKNAARIYEFLDHLQ